MPARDVLRGLDMALGGRAALLAAVGVGMLVGWWVYVPVHELLHAFACLAAGGEVSRLEVAPLYGGHVLAAWLPWVVAGGDYAGRLAGFDTGGSDLVYLATDFGPYALTIFPGVWWLRWAARRRRAFQFGASLPLALAPFMSLPGDAYEVGSIVVTRLGAWRRVAELRGDDVAVVAARLAGAPAGLWWGFGLAVFVGLVWAFLVYGGGALVARALGEAALEVPGRGREVSGTGSGRVQEEKERASPAWVSSEVRPGTAAPTVGEEEQRE